VPDLQPNSFSGNEVESVKRTQR